MLVTGGAGFIGSHLVDRLVQMGMKVRVLDDFSSGRAENLCEVESEISVFEGSILDPGLLSRASEGCRGIFHLAAVVSVPRSIQEPVRVHEVNTTGTLNVLETARRTGARVVLSSSAAVYGSATSSVQFEADAAHPLSPYGIQKLLGEMYVRTYHELHGVPGFSLRYFNVYGSRQDPCSPYSGVISIFSRLAMLGAPITIFGDGRQTRDYVHVSDVVNANILAMNARCADGAVLNVGTGRQTDLNTIAGILLKALESRSTILYAEPRLGDILNSCAATELSARRINFYASVNIEAGLGLIEQPASHLTTNTRVGP